MEEQKRAGAPAQQAAPCATGVSAGKERIYDEKYRGEPEVGRGKLLTRVLKYPQMREGKMHDAD